MKIALNIQAKTSIKPLMKQFTSVKQSPQPTVNTLSKPTPFKCFSLLLINMALCGFFLNRWIITAAKGSIVSELEEREKV